MQWVRISQSILILIVEGTLTMDSEQDPRKKGEKWGTVEKWKGLEGARQSEPVHSFGLPLVYVDALIPVVQVFICHFCARVIR